MNKEKTLPNPKKSLRRFLSFRIGAVILMGVCLGALGGIGVASAETVVFSNIETNARKDISTTIQYNTDIAATGQIEYGLDTNYGNLAEEKGLSYWQSIELTDLTGGTVYHYRIRAKGYEDNETVSDDYTFTTRTQEELEALVRAARINNDLPKNYYVKTDGDDTKDGLTTETAWQHPSYAVGIAEAGDTIYLIDDLDNSDDGIWYDEHCVFVNSGIDTHRITLTAYNGAPTLDGLDKTGGGIDFLGNSYIDISDLKVITYCQCFADSTNSSYINISNCVLGNSSGVVIAVYCGSHHVWIMNNTIYDSGWNTIQIVGQDASHLLTHHVCVRNNNFNDTIAHTGGVDIMNDTTDIDIIGNTFNNSNAILYVHGQYVNGSYRINVRDNILHNMHGDAMDFMWTRDSIAINNTVHYASGNGIYSYVGLVGRAINLTVKNNKVYDVEGGYYYRLSVRTESGVGREQLLLVDNNNEIDSTQYVIESDTTDGLLRFTKYAKSFMLIVAYSGKATVEFTDGRVFTQKISAYSPYTLTSPRYYPDKSNSTLEDLGGGSDILNVTTYPITFTPTIENEYLTTTSVSDTSVTVESTVQTNPTTIGYTNLSYADTNVILVVDGEDYSSELADAEGVVSHYYTGLWDTSHTFTWKQGEVSTGTLTGTVINSSDIAIEEATISDGTRSTTTDSIGNYTLSNIPIGIYTITCTKNNYQDNSQPNIIIEEDQTTILNFTLEEIQTPTVTLQKQTDKTEANEGETITYTITYTNTGDALANNIVITDNIPTNTTYIDNSATGSYTYNNNTLTWTIDSLDAGEQGSVSFQVRIDEEGMGMNVLNNKYALYTPTLFLLSCCYGRMRKKRLKS